MNSKEAFKRILEDVKNYYSNEYIQLVEQDLDRLETFDYIIEQNVTLREENIKLKKAIDILKINHLIVMENRNSDTGYIVSIESDITQHEYELLKEILEHVKRN